MNTIVKIITYLLKFLNFWIFTIPIRYSIFAIFFYFGMMHLIFGSASMNDLQYGADAISPFGQFIAFLFFGLPGFISFFAIFSDTDSTAGNTFNGHLDDVIAHRNNMMNYSTPKEAYQIMKKTSHLDVMKSSPEFNNALKGFNATSGRESPSRVYKELMKK